MYDIPFENKSQFNHILKFERLFCVKIVLELKIDY